MSPAPCLGLGSGPEILDHLDPLYSPPQAQNRMSRTQNLIQTLVAGIAPATRSRAAPQALILDALCLILDILAPKLRPVSALSGGQSGGVAAAGGGPWPCSASIPIGEHAAVQHS